MLMGYVQLTYRFEKEGTEWVGTCIELGTSTFGRSLKRVKRDLEQMVIEYLNVLEEDGTRERIFRENNISMQEAPVGESVYQETHTLLVGSAA